MFRQNLQPSVNPKTWEPLWIAVTDMAPDEALEKINEYFDALKEAAVTEKQKSAISGIYINWLNVYQDVKSQVKVWGAKQIDEWVSLFEEAVNAGWPEEPLLVTITEEEKRKERNKMLFFGGLSAAGILTLALLARRAYR